MDRPRDPMRLVGASAILNGTSIEHHFARISPKIAQGWLTEHNLDNRALNKRQVEHLSVVMHSGELVPVSDCIAFDETGELINGQHRLEAVVQTGLPQNFNVLVGLPPKAKDYIDAGGIRVRNASDLLYMAGYRDRIGKTAEAATWCNRYLTHRPKPSLKVFPHEVLAFVGANPNLGASLEFVMDNRDAAVGKEGMISALHYLCSHIDQAGANDYVLGIVKGAASDLGQNDIRSRIRGKLIDLRFQNRNGQGTTVEPSYVTFAHMIKGWKSYRDHKPVKALRFLNTSEFPRVEGLEDWKIDLT